MPVHSKQAEIRLRRKFACCDATLLALWLTPYCTACKILVLLMAWQKRLKLLCYLFEVMTLFSTMYGISAASQGASPRQRACATPKRGLHTTAKSVCEQCYDTQEPVFAKRGQPPHVLMPGPDSPVLCPERFEMYCEAYRAPTVHLSCLAI